VAKTEAEIQAEVDAFLNTLDKPTRPAAPSPSAPVKSSDGKTVKELIDEGRTAEAIELGSSIAAKAERDRVMAEISHSQVREAFQNKRAQANRKVYLNHPELLDIDRGTKKHSEVPFAAAIKQVYDEYPNLLDAAEGPLMAMEIAEKRLGYKKDNDRAVQSGKTEGAEAEKARQDTARASAALASSSSGAMPPAAPTVTLSDSEKIVAGKLGLTEQDYGTKKGRQTVFNAAYYAKYRGGPKPKR
jgi:phage I-like protein